MDKINNHSFWSNPTILKGDNASFWLNMVKEIGWHNVGALLLMTDYIKMGYSMGMDDEAVIKDIKSYFTDDEKFDELISNYQRYVKVSMPQIPKINERKTLEDRSEMIQIMAEGLSAEWTGKIKDLVGILDNTAEQLKQRGIATWWK